MNISIIKQFFQLLNKKEAMPFCQIFSPSLSGTSGLSLEEGWRDPEENRQWSVGVKAKINLPLGVGVVSQIPNPLYMICKISTFIVSGKHDQQEVNILVNDLLVGSIVLKSNDFVPIVFALPNRVISAREINIILETPDSISPAELGLSPDTAQLGVCLSFFAIINDSYYTQISTNSSLQEFRSLEEYENYNFKRLQRNNDCFMYENVIALKEKKDDQLELPGYCLACQEKANFSISQCYGERVNYREQLFCSRCRLKSRQRAVIELVRKRIATNSSIKRIFIYERVGLFYQFFADHLRGVETIGSEYLGHSFLPGQEYDGIRHEDALNFSFEDGSFDVLLSCDVFEHVPDIEKALIEAHRILADDGSLYFTVPFDSRKRTTQTRAQFQDSNLEFLCPPEYHGNPIDKKGSLVFYDFSWDILKICLKAGFRDAYAVSFWGADNGYLGVGELFVFMAEK